MHLDSLEPAAIQFTPKSLLGRGLAIIEATEEAASVKTIRNPAWVLTPFLKLMLLYLHNFKHNGLVFQLEWSISMLRKYKALTARSIILLKNQDTLIEQSVLSYKSEKVKYSNKAITKKVALKESSAPWLTTSYMLLGFTVNVIKFVISHAIIVGIWYS